MTLSAFEAFVLVSLTLKAIGLKNWLSLIAAVEKVMMTAQLSHQRTLSHLDIFYIKKIKQILAWSPDLLI